MASEVEKSAPPKKGLGGMLIIGVVAVVAMGAGFALPIFLGGSEAAKHTKKEVEAKKPVLLTFGEVTVNLGEERLNRYLRAKIILVVDGNQEKAITEHLQKQKPYLKSWLIGYLADLSLQEVGRTAGVNRIRREIREQFNALLYPDGSELVQEVLFDEFVVQ